MLALSTLSTQHTEYSYACSDHLVSCVYIQIISFAMLRWYSWHLPLVAPWPEWNLGDTCYIWALSTLSTQQIKHGYACSDYLVICVYIQIISFAMLGWYSWHLPCVATWPDWNLGDTCDMRALSTLSTQHTEHSYACSDHLVGCVYILIISFAMLW